MGNVSICIYQHFRLTEIQNVLGLGFSLWFNVCKEFLLSSKLYEIVNPLFVKPSHIFSEKSYKDNCRIWWPVGFEAETVAFLLLIVCKNKF